MPHYTTYALYGGGKERVYPVATDVAEAKQAFKQAALCCLSNNSNGGYVVVVTDTGAESVYEVRSESKMASKNRDLDLAMARELSKKQKQGPFKKFSLA